ncbi:TlpA disulfide reductase family protein [Halobacillus rhizosphaerae]|uniref:TlpA disulfide reductase family protein n=1 Tax=Halobacillus rhizosphaerae TaxID=3064889 RepID=UPI00398B5328
MLVLIGMLVVTVADYKKDQQKKEDVTAEISNSESNQDGTMMVAPNAPRELKTGEKAPDFTLETLNGDSITLDDLKGKKVFLNFWATWCPPCQEEMPELETFYQDFGDEVEIVAVNATGSEKGVAEVNKYMKEHHYHFPVVLDKELKVNDLYQALTIPTTYFIGTDGRIQLPKIVGPMTYDVMVKMKESLE